MANERTYPCLPCRDLDESVAFYEALGFKQTYRQLKPNPYGVVAREDIHLHLFGIENFDPALSYGNVIVVVPDPDSLYQAFAAGLRAAYKKLPAAGIPRILRPRKKFGTVRGFSVVDPGGNWLRISKVGDSASEENSSGLAGVLEVATRLGDAHGDEAKALKVLESGLKRFPDAPLVDLARVLLYRAELAMRSNNLALARSSLAAMLALELNEDDRASLGDDIRQTSEIVLGASGL
ncbi:MAG: VOC family protein [Bryobacteraceae bacterium]